MLYNSGQHPLHLTAKTGLAECKTAFCVQIHLELLARPTYQHCHSVIHQREAFSVWTGAIGKPGRTIRMQNPNKRYNDRPTKRANTFIIGIVPATE